MYSLLVCDITRLGQPSQFCQLRSCFPLGSVQPWHHQSSQPSIDLVLNTFAFVPLSPFVFVGHLSNDKLGVDFQFEVFCPQDFGYSQASEGELILCICYLVFRRKVSFWKRDFNTEVCLSLSFDCYLWLVLNVKLIKLDRPSNHAPCYIRTTHRLFNGLAFHYNDGMSLKVRTKLPRCEEQSKCQFLHPWVFHLNPLKSLTCVVDRPLDLVLFTNQGWIDCCLGYS